MSFGATSRGFIECVREEILKMHTLLTDPLTIITFINDCAIINNCAMKKSPYHGNMKPISREHGL